MPIRVIFLSLFYFWLKLEDPLRNVSEKEANQSIPVSEAIEKIIIAIKAAVDKVPSYNPSSEMQKLGGGINELKSHLSDEILDHLSPDALIKICQSKLEMSSSSKLEMSGFCGSSKGVIHKFTALPDL